MPLKFLGRLSSSPVRDLLGVNPDIPTRTPGAYILLAKSDILFRYPLGDSPVFYIGKADNGVRGRLMTHRKNILEAKDNRAHCIYRPLREYGAAFGTLFAYVPAGSEWAPGDLEVQLMARFAKRYGSLPVANSAGDWNRIRGVINGMVAPPAGDDAASTK